jgi:hypothetical protein
MNARTRRKLEMGERALEFTRAHPDTSPGYEAAVTRLDEALNRADLLTDQQRNGLVEVHIASGRKRDLRRALRKGHLAHLGRVARVAEKEAPGLTQRFKVGLTGSTYLGFRAAARGMVAEAAARQELLIRHGLSTTVLDALSQGLDQFDAAVKQGTEGRRAHIGASADLDAVAAEIVQIVRVMDGLNRVRFTDDDELLPAWVYASTVGATPIRAPVEPVGEEVKPAA